MNLLAYWNDELMEVSFFEENGYAKMTINGGLQFDEKDEYRYHQTLFLLPALTLNPKKENNVLVLGGGDGLGTRELLRVPHIKKITLVDISPFIVNLAKYHPRLREMNLNAFHDNRVNIIIDDALEYVKKANDKYDLIILDYPDPSIEKNSPVNELFTKGHYTNVKRLLKKEGILAMQATSVRISPNVFRYLYLMLEDLFESIVPLRINIASYGDIGVLLAKEGGDIQIKTSVPEGTFFTENSIQEFMYLHADELSDIPDEELKEKHISQIAYYDLNIRPSQLKEEIIEIIKGQINGKTDS